MKLVPALSFALAIAAAGTSGFASETDPHAGHHPAAAAVAPAPVAPVPSNGTSLHPSTDMERMDTQMKAMQTMHAKMMAAKTTVERNALMADQMKVMQDSMNMMNEMFPGGMGSSNMMDGMPKAGAMGDMKGDTAAHHQMMEKRMQMMQAMMQMMMDRISAPPAK